MAAVVLVVGDGVRFRERTRGEEERANARERRGEVRGVVASFQGVQGDEREKQEVAGRVAVAGCGAGTHLLGEGEKTTEEEAGWAGLASWAGQAAQCWASTEDRRQVSLFSLIFSFLFFDICFDLIKILNHFIYLCQFL